MKKSFLVLICVVFIAAVVSVGVFGRPPDPLLGATAYPEHIECDTYRVNNGEVKLFRNGDEHYDYYETFYLDRSADATVIELLPTVTPVEASKDCTYVITYAERYTGITIDSQTGVITIDHSFVINSYGKIQGAKSFVVIVTSNQDAALHQKILIMME